MRPAKNPQSRLRAPLNRILGTEAGVRVLRALFEAGAPLTRRALAARTGSRRPGSVRDWIAFSPEASWKRRGKPRGRDGVRGDCVEAHDLAEGFTP